MRGHVREQKYSREKQKKPVLCPSVINLSCTIFNFSDPTNTSLTPQKALSFSVQSAMLKGKVLANLYFLNAFSDPSPNRQP
jgi:hypothetical protein